MATWRMSIFLNFSHFPFVGGGGGIFSRSLSKLVLISPCLCLSRAFASFLLYRDIPALLSLGLGPLFLGPESPPLISSSFLTCLSLYLHFGSDDVSSGVITVSGSMFTVWVSVGDWACLPVLTPSSRPHGRTPHQPQPTMRWVGGDPGTQRAQSRALTGLRAPTSVRRALSSGVTISAQSLLCACAAHSVRVMISCSAGPGRAGRRTFKHEIRRTNDGFSLPYKGVELPGGWDKF